MTSATILFVGKDGRFLLALKSGNNGTISYFGYDGWRFFRYKTKTDFPGSSHPISLTYSFSIDNQTMFLAHHTDFTNNVSKTSNLYEVKFVKEFAKFSMINHTLSKIHEVNGSLNKLSARVESMIQNMVLLNGTNNITGVVAELFLLCTLKSLKAGFHLIRSDRATWRNRINESANRRTRQVAQ